MSEAIYGCDTCRTTIGRAGCPTHRDSATYGDPTQAGRYEWSGSSLVLTHCIHGLDLRIHPRCYLCRPAPDTAWTRCRDGGQCDVPRHYHAPQDQS